MISQAPVLDTSCEVLDLQANWNKLQPAWDDFVDSHLKGSIFHTSDMVRVFAAAKGNHPLALAAVDGQGAIQALLVGVRVQTLPGVLGGVSSRSILYAEPLCHDDEASIDALVAVIRKHDDHMRRNTLFTEVRPLCAPGPERVALERCGYQYLDYLNYIVDVSSPPDEIWSRMQRCARRSIKKLEGAGFQVHELTTPDAVDKLYEFVALSYEKARVPFADKSLFTAANRILSAKNQFRIIAVERDNELLTVYAMLRYKERVFAWYIGTKRMQGNSPVDLLKWREFLWSHEQGCTKYDMGGAGWPDEGYGVRDYKAKFGGELVRFGRYRKVYSQWKMALAERAYAVGRRIISFK